MLTIHHLRSQSERIVWLAEELEILSNKIYNRRQDNQLAPDDYKSLHPMGIAPVVTDKGFVLAESGAIMDWMIGTCGASELVPDPESPDYATHLFFYHWANATFMTNGDGFGCSIYGCFRDTVVCSGQNNQVMEQ